MTPEAPKTLHYGQLQEIQHKERVDRRVIAYTTEDLACLLGYESLEEYKTATSEWLNVVKQTFATNGELEFAFHDTPELHTDSKVPGNYSEARYVAKGRSGNDLWLVHVVPPYSNTSLHQNSVAEWYIPQSPGRLYLNGERLDEPKLVPVNLLHQSGTLGQAAQTIVIMKNGFVLEGDMYRERTDLHFHPPLIRR